MRNMVKVVYYKLKVWKFVGDAEVAFEQSYNKEYEFDSENPVFDGYNLIYSKVKEDLSNKHNVSINRIVICNVFDMQSQ